MACDQEVIDQETAFLEALQGVALIETRGQQVNLTDLQGAIKVTLVRPEPLAPASPGPSGEPTRSPAKADRPRGHADADPDADPEPTPTPRPRRPDADGRPLRRPPFPRSSRHRV